MKITIFTFNDPLYSKHGGGTRLLKMIDYISRRANVIVVIPTLNQHRSIKYGNAKFLYIRISSMFRIVFMFIRLLEKLFRLQRGFLVTTFHLIYYDYKIAAFLREMLLDSDILQSEFHGLIDIPIKTAKKMSIAHVHTVHDIVTYWYLNEKSWASRFLIKILFSIECRQLSKIGTLVFLSKLDYSIAEKVMGLTKNEKWIVPNGVDEAFLDIVRNPADDEVLFIGSYYFPNIEAASFILREIAPRLTDIKFIIIGAVCDELIKLGSIPSNVILKGIVSDDELLRYYARATVGIIPLMRGSGMKVKMSEFLAAGIPVITTSIGCQGFDLVNGKDVIIEDELSRFSYWIKKLLGDKKFSYLLGKNGRDYAMKLTWDKTLETYMHIYNKIKS